MMLYYDLHKWIDNGASNLEALKFNCINCSNKRLEKLPYQIGKFYCLIKLDCSFNQLTKLPKEIGNLIKLKKLYCNLINLELLDCNTNLLICLSKEMDA